VKALIRNPRVGRRRYVDIVIEDGGPALMALQKMLAIVLWLHLRVPIPSDQANDLYHQRQTRELGHRPELHGLRTPPL